VTEGSKITYAIAGHSSLWYPSFDRREMSFNIFFHWSSTRARDWWGIGWIGSASTGIVARPTVHSVFTSFAGEFRALSLSDVQGDPITKLLMAFGMPCARKDLSWCRVLVPQTPFRCHCSGLTGPSCFSIALLAREVQQTIATLLPSAHQVEKSVRTSNRLLP